MAEVLQKAPRLWSTILNPRNFTTLAEFQTAIKYHEDLLIEFGERYEKIGRPSNPKSYTYKVDSKPQTKNTFQPNRDKFQKSKSTRTYAIGSSNPPKPAHPKDDSNVSKPKTPADYNARGCIFCGSRMHWDRDCKHSQGQATRSARAMFVDSESSEDIYAELEYENCYNDNIGQSSHNSDQESSQDDEGENQSSNPEDSEESDF
jgi:hypothetical protein